MRIKIRQLQAFREVVRNGSITSAAHALGLSQPTVSNLIIGLENELGVTLFQRIHKRLVPTQDARKFFAEVDRTFNSIEQLSSTANRLHTKSSAWLNVVLPQSFVVNIVPQALARLRKSHPGIGVTLEFLPTRDAIDYAASGEWDLTIARLPATHRGLDVKPLMTSEYVCVLPKGHRLVALDSLDPADLRDEAVILLSRRHEERFEIVDSFRKVGVDLVGLVETGALTGACAFTSAGLGVTVLDAIVARGYPDSNLVIRPFRPAIRNQFGLLLEKGGEMSAEAEIFLQAIVETVSDLSRDFEGIHNLEG